MTNLNDGMILGYKEAVKWHSNLTNSRVILMTDGETNKGEVNTDNIINNSLKYNEEGIEISTIGIGQSLDFDLLRQLADKGKGSNYYIGEHDEDIYKVFDQELDGLLYKIGSNPQLEIKLPKEWTIEQVYGYETKSELLSSNQIKFNLDNLGASSTRIVLLRVKGRSKSAISAELSYFKNGKVIRLDKKLNYSTEQNITNEELRKNYDIAFMAHSLKKACSDNDLNRIFSARSAINNTIEWMRESPFYSDDDFQRVYKIIEQYKTKDNHLY